MKRLTPSHLNDLNPQQLEAVTYPGGPLLILAGAGSGKTRVLAHRIACLLEGGVEPHRVLAITFTNKAAQEMKGRVERLLGRGVAAGLWMGTFHAVCARILRREAGWTGLGANFSILDEDDQAAVVKECVEGLGLDPEAYSPAWVVPAISRAKDELLGPEDLAARARDLRGRNLARVFARYQERLRAANSVDFGDLISLTVRLLESVPERREVYSQQFQHILVDEYQDTNHAQYRLVSLLASTHQNLMVVGDDDQSIYRWRGADIRNILEFERDFPRARVVRLEENYRSRQAILDAANQVISRNRMRKGKTLFTRRGYGERPALYQARDGRDEAAFVASEVERLLGEGFALGDCAVLYRTHAQSRVLEEVLMERRLPYVLVGGVRFYERREVKDVLAYLRLISNPADDLAFRRALGAPRRGVGPGTLARLESAAAGRGLSLLEAASRAREFGLGGRAAALEAFAGLVKRLAEGRDRPVREQLEAVLEGSGYLSSLEEGDGPDALSRLENLKELLSVAEEYDRSGEGGGLEGFLAEAALMSEADAYRGGADALALMTFHSAKGLEFKVVFMVGLEEGLFPHQRSLDEDDALEEERRLCYVGMTRAAEALYLSFAAFRMTRGQYRQSVPSRFLSEIGPGSLRPLCPPGVLVPLRSSRAVGAARDSREAAGRGAPPAGAALGAGRTPAPAAGRSGPGPSEETLRPGDRVLHHRWGEGTVVQCRGEGEDAEVAVAFPGAGVRRLLLRYAGLKRAQ
ncbi:MAG: UvrD-helicase domain-containing protein [Acetobacteraceae bacterium]|nr:UvrD-helicase domain-containing protein [Acetobacteraceae bacterium]